MLDACIKNVSHEIFFFHFTNYSIMTHWLMSVSLFILRSNALQDVFITLGHIIYRLSIKVSSDSA